MTTCPHHGAYTSRTGACPTCRDVEDARAVLSRGNGSSAAHRRARELLADLGERGGDGWKAGPLEFPGFRDDGGDAISFDLGGAA